LKIDLHVHCSERSSCAVSDADSQIRAAIEMGLDALAFTDHFRLVPPDELIALNERFAPFRVYSGIEITADKEDWLVFGIQDPKIERRLWTYPDLWNFVRERQGVMILAHPFRWEPLIHVDLATYPPDGVEFRSHNTPAEREEEIIRLACQYGLGLFQNSDSHHVRMIGQFYNDLPGRPDSEASLLESLRALKALTPLCRKATEMRHTPHLR